MINILTRLPIVDNSGAIEAGCIFIFKGIGRTGAFPGGLLIFFVKKIFFKKIFKKKIVILSKGKVLKDFILTSVRWLKRVGNFSIRSESNNSILLNQYLLPYGTRIFGPVFREIRQKTNYRKVVSLARVTV